MILKKNEIIIQLKLESVQKIKLRTSSKNPPQHIVSGNWIII